ncbi:Retrovirus-related Pol polyprotein from transposon TNT 1-94 [Sesamum angolense]|uniref:Retrovirus-related Pol polyprotein from transposon TNT 1-94 n=1 Tax=Sesamum angolense TaxID=2727404 RepID=A0AAE1WAX8_9LAMI|nr:Retrovirus-related Pol polyprotein from transposon TNT 1-94 [Sesamum angolense]
MVLSMMSFTELPPSCWGYAVETAGKLLNMASSKTLPQKPYEIWHGKPASYKYLEGYVGVIHFRWRITEGLLSLKVQSLKQVSQSWNTRFDEVLLGYDFIKNKYDPCVYKKISRSTVAYVVLYVDDILLIGNDVKMLDNIKAWLSTQFSMKDIGEASYILGIKIYRDRSRRKLD